MVTLLTLVLVTVITGCSPARPEPPMPLLQESFARPSDAQAESEHSPPPSRPPLINSSEVEPGDTLTQENLPQAEGLLTPFTRWMVERGMPMQIIETKRVHWPKAYTEATEQYAKQVQLSAEGKDILNYVAGRPFPAIDLHDPLAGYKVMWNFYLPPFDNAAFAQTAKVVNRNGKVVATDESVWRCMKWTGRLYLNPKPLVPHTPPLRMTCLAGSSLLLLWYLPHDVPDEIYGYSREARKVSRVPRLNRSQAPEPWGWDLDSFNGFSGKMGNWTFRLLAEKDILAVVHSGKYGDSSQWCAPHEGEQGILAALPCVSWEKRRVWVVEGRPTGYRQYAYSKRILYIDQDFFGVLVSEMYDQAGELWKGLVYCYHYTRKPHESYPAHPLEGAKYNYEDPMPFVPNGVMLDMQRDRATVVEIPSSAQQPSEWHNEMYFNEKVSTNVPEVYSRNYLGRRGR